MKEYTIVVILEKKYRANSVKEANKHFQQDKSLFHPNWKIKNEMFLRPQLDPPKSEEE